MEKLIRNTGLHHLADHIFDFVDNYSLAQCMLVCKEWNQFLSRIILVRQFDKLLVFRKFDTWNEVSEVTDDDYIYLPKDWHEAAHYFRRQCSIEELKLINRVLSEWFHDHFSYCPLEFAAKRGYEDFFTVILMTSIGLNRRDTESYHSSI